MRAQALVSNSYSCSALHRAKLANAMPACHGRAAGKRPCRRKCRAGEICTALQLLSGAPHCPLLQQRAQKTCFARSSLFCVSQESTATPRNRTVGCLLVHQASALTSSCCPGQSWWSQPGWEPLQPQWPSPPPATLPISLASTPVLPEQHLWGKKKPNKNSWQEKKKVTSKGHIAGNTTNSIQELNLILQCFYQQRSILGDLPFGITSSKNGVHLLPSHVLQDMQVSWLMCKLGTGTQPFFYPRAPEILDPKHFFN